MPRRRPLACHDCRVDTSNVACSRFLRLLNRWETEFLSGLQRFPRLSTKQRAILDRIVTRLRAAGCSL